MLADFKPTEAWLLDPGDMLYLPPGWAHDGVARGEAITASIGFRAAGTQALGVEVAQLLLDAVELPEGEPRYADPKQDATIRPARIPPALQRFAHKAVARILRDRQGQALALGEALSEPKPGVWFDAGSAVAAGAGVRLDRRTRMLYDDHHVFVNGEAFHAAGRDARLVRRLADRRLLGFRDLAALSRQARGLIDLWAESGWLHAESGPAAAERD
jgi:50S ribosomal protein L16 3-hydroxylase